MSIKVIKSFLLVSILFFTSCVGTSYLKKDEKLLYKQKIKGNENISSDRLDDLYTQKANKRILLLPISPYVAFYEVGKQYYDKEEIEQKLEDVQQTLSQKIELARENEKFGRATRLERKLNNKSDKLNTKLKDGNILMRWGEPLAIYDSTATERTEDQIQLFLESKGFFDAEVDYVLKEKGYKDRRVIVTYHIEENKSYVIDTVFYDVGDDKVMMSVLIGGARNSLVKAGNTYDQSKLTQERERIETLMKNNGYYTFSRQFVEFNVFRDPDTTSLALEILINKPQDGQNHKRYTLDEVNFTTDVNTQIGGVKRTVEKFNSINYSYYEHTYKKRILDQRVFLRPGEFYSLEKTLNTQRQLANLDMFRFVNIKYDTAGGDFVANIFTSPLEKYQLSNEVGVNVNVTFGLPGPFYNVSLKNRNPFGGIEVMELSGRLGVEGVASLSDETNVTTATEARANLSFTFPHFLFPFGTQLKSRFALLNPKTKTGLGFNYTKRPEFERSNLNASYGYSWQNKMRWMFDLTITDVNLIESDLEKNFRDALEEQATFGRQLSRSFLPSFVSSSSINISKNFNNYGQANSRASFIKFFAETGGNLLNVNAISKNINDDSLAYFQFLKASVDYRTYIPYGRESTFAYRFHVGVAKPYGEFSRGLLPYEKYYFAGGSNSIRAWAPRRLGPGSFVETDEEGNFIYNFERPGEIILETSIEVRRNLISFLDGALFLDAGNVWSFSENDEPGSDFQLDSFFNEIAVGTGFGLRIDFSFLIMRFDLAFKLYDPARDPGERWTIDEWNLGTRDNYGPALNIGIGYPF
ncbi:BamA/TamA family outer membrane protein [Marivirga salinae]|uniref:BamA/TamA family outer membrane protein n=1 Tax=Marivirga salinarum TaxID=3059078 RepID=A0AA51ND48_9BACT|nr:BamA/TamA family outer membrane protein [Marivirga sp. BDSF4-3]WMN12759.1 BamA/TamA family outer membrane protein [Marivirga sp. BDSF4-3]